MTNLASKQSKHSATDFWNNSLHNGAVSLGSAGYAAASDSEEDKNIIEKVVDIFKKEDEETAASSQVGAAASISISAALSAVAAMASGGTELFLYTKTGIGTGSQAANPWLQELPDPITKMCWDNYITMSPGDVAEGGFNMHLGEKLPASLATVEVNGASVTLPVVPVPGQKSGTIGIALGYGRGANGENIGKAAFQTGEYGGYLETEEGVKRPIGANAYALATMDNGVCTYSAVNTTITNTGETYKVAATQTQHTVMERDSVVKETTLNTFKTADSKVYNKPHTLPMHENGETVQKPISEVDLWDQHPIEDIGHWWGMNIDLSTCLGCSACVTACHSENNVPVVGKDEVRRSRDMHWMRIDRYFSSDMTKERAEDEGLGAIDMYRKMEDPAVKPSVVHMPMMCQHCNHAPCETVCPVAATTHSSEGLNQMTYNRCIGTRYCANNCPYKVRRFNWFNYKAYSKFSEVNPSQDWVGRLVLNPDVTVRSRGVMEKCSMCVQRIQAGKLEAKIEGQPVADGAIVTACSEACPTNAITFGDMNDTGSAVAADKQDKRTYMSLEEVGTRPSVSYKVKVRNRDENQA
jgi:molybdopterin-containing oxidoreductase family iron-sulfur binding subunit